MQHSIETMIMEARGAAGCDEGCVWAVDEKVNFGKKVWHQYHGKPSMSPNEGMHISTDYFRQTPIEVLVKNITNFFLLHHAEFRPNVPAPDAGLIYLVDHLGRRKA